MAGNQNTSKSGERLPRYGGAAGLAQVFINRCKLVHLQFL